MNDSTADDDTTTTSDGPKVKAVHYYHNASYHGSQASCRTPTATAVTWKKAVDDSVEVSEVNMQGGVPGSPMKKRKTRSDYVGEVERQMVSPYL